MMDVIYADKYVKMPFVCEHCILLDERKILKKMFQYWGYKSSKNMSRKVLVYDAEKGETSKCFIAALKCHLNDFKVQDFAEAEDDDRDTLPIIAVVRHTSIRTKECIYEVKDQLKRDNVKSFGRVILAYFYVYGTVLHMLVDTHDARQYNFAAIVQMNFTDISLVYTNIFGIPVKFLNILKFGNRSALLTIQNCIRSSIVQTQWFVNIYFVRHTSLVEEFVEVLRQNISSSIHLLDAQLIINPTDVISPALVCIEGNGNVCHEHLEKIGGKKVFLVDIIDVGKRFETRLMDDILDHMENTLEIHREQNLRSALSVGAGNNTAQLAENKSCEIHEILYYNRKFKFDFGLKRKFETFVRA